jgi:hypothetical protein
MTRAPAAQNQANARGERPSPSGLHDQTRFRVGPACAGLPTAWFFESRDPGDPALGAHERRQAIEACRGCPIREACLMGALDRNEEHGRWGGAGEQRRRTLRKARAVGRLGVVLAAHWRNLDGRALPGDRVLLAGFGDGATHGRPGTYAKGCRCDPCCLAIAAREVTASLRPPSRRRRSSAAASAGHAA